MSYFTKRYHPPGTGPGTLIAKEGTAGSITIHLVDYSAERFIERADARAEDCRAYLQSSTVTWIHIQGLPAPEVLHQLGAMFELHPLALEDVLNIGQRPKAEVYDTQLFVVMALPIGGSEDIQTEQISVFFGENFIVSFHAGEHDPFEPIRQRLRSPGSRLRSRGADHLLYALTDRVIDEGFPVLEAFGLRIEALEDELLEAPGRDTLNEIHALKRDLLLLRRMVWPHREILNVLMRDEHPLIQEGTLIYLRDCYDHTVQILDLLETYRDMTASMLDVYLSSISNRTNEIMRVLTVIATIFIPLTFIVGVYGMNFDRAVSPWNMPELGWRFGYPLLWLLMIGMVVGLLAYFRRKRWL